MKESMVRDWEGVCNFIECFDSKNKLSNINNL